MNEELVKRLRNDADWYDVGNDIDSSEPMREAANLIEQQARDIDALKHDIEHQIAIASEEATRADAFEKDATRFRWLRRQAIAVRNYASGNPNWEIDWALRGESFEAAIDAAMAQKEG